jgi:cytosine/adenosine deaminase-related metal-dependent hydrolase
VDGILAQDHQRFDATGCVVLPGLVNTHHHLYQTRTRAWRGAVDSELFPWLRTLYPVWAQLDNEDFHRAAVVGCQELLRSGCTLTTDHHYLFPRAASPELLDITIEAARKTGIRFHPTRGSMSRSQKDGGLPPDDVVQDADTILADCERVIGKWHDPQPGALVRIALAPCSPFSVDPDLMRRTAELARHYGVRLHTHLAETRDENDYCLQFAAPRLPRIGGLDGTGRVAGARHLVQRRRDRAPGPRRHGHRPLPHVEHAPGVGHLPRARPAPGRLPGGSGRRRLGQQRQLEPAG